MEDLKAIVASLRQRGVRVTPQRAAIVEEVLRLPGHITPPHVTRRVQERMATVDPSTVYRTLSLLEELGVVKHKHTEAGAVYHRASECDHTHLCCSRCATESDLPAEVADELATLVRRRTGFHPDLTHFAIAGVCVACQQAGEGRPGNS